MGKTLYVPEDNDILIPNVAAKYCSYEFKQSFLNF